MSSNFHVVKITALKCFQLWYILLKPWRSLLIETKYRQDWIIFFPFFWGYTMLFWNYHPDFRCWLKCYKKRKCIYFFSQTYSRLNELYNANQAQTARILKASRVIREISYTLRTYLSAMCRFSVYFGKHITRPESRCVARYVDRIRPLNLEPEQFDI